MPARKQTVPRTTPATWKSFVFHGLSLYALVQALQNLKEPTPLANFIQTQMGGWYQFLTVLGLYATIITMALAAAKDLLPSLRFLDYLKNTIGIISVPAEGLISVLYWGLRAIDPSLLMPPDPKYAIPLVLDLSLHALPAAILWADFLFLSPPFSETSRPFLLSVLLTASYTSWMEYCRYYNGSFPYPFLGDLSIPQRIVFYSAAALINVVLFKLANGIHFGVDRLLGKNVRAAKRQAQGKKQR